jgi:hypothetical protein
MDKTRYYRTAETEQSILGFYPDLTIKFDWTKLVKQARTVAQHYVRTDKFKDNLSYLYGPSQVSDLPSGGWISKQSDSYDFFVMGGHPELNYLSEQFAQAFPELTFSPPTIGYSTKDIPEHIDYEGNGLSSLIFPLNSVDSHGRVVGDNETFEYTFDKPVIININRLHGVTNNQERICFCIHFHQTVSQVKESFDRLGQVVIQ